jgi:hypothetical protein
MNFIFRFLKDIKTGKFIDGNLIGDKNREERRKEKHHKNKHHHFSDNENDDNWTY